LVSVITAWIVPILDYFCNRPFAYGSFDIGLSHHWALTLPIQDTASQKRTTAYIYDKIGINKHLQQTFRNKADVLLPVFMQRAFKGIISVLRNVNFKKATIVTKTGGASHHHMLLQIHHSKVIYVTLNFIKCKKKKNYVAGS
jgi:hypothetical protein